MKISYVLGKPPISPISDNNEVIKNSNKGLSDFSLEDRWRVRALEVSPIFNEEIIKTRKLLNIPIDGFSYEEFLGIYNFLEWGYVRESWSKKTEEEFNQKIDTEIKRIFNEYECDLFVKRQLKTILLANIVLSSHSNMSDWGEISLDTFFTAEDYDNEKREKSVVIKITSEVSPEAIIQYIRDRRSNIKKLLSKLPEKKKFILSDKKIKIFQLGNDPQLTYENIAAKLSTIWDISSKNVEKIYRETKEDILSLFNKKLLKTDEQ